jgi:hypothetical protein
MNLDENSVNDFYSSQGLRPIDGELATERCVPVKSREPLEEEASRLSSMATTVSNKREQERLHRLERELVDRLIQEYERVVEKGLPPERAIASMLEWVSRECPRLLP